MKNHYVFIHHDTANHIGTGAKWFIVANYETTGTNGLDTSTIVNSSTHSYFKALEDNRRWSTSPGDSGAMFTDQLGYPITSNFPIGEFEDAATRGPAHLNVVEVRAEGSASSTLSELYQEITTAVAGASQNVTTAMSNVDQQSSASVNLSVLSNPTITYPQSSNAGNYPPDFAAAMSGNENPETFYHSGDLGDALDIADLKKNDESTFWNTRALVDLIQDDTMFEACSVTDTYKDVINNVKASEDYFKLNNVTPAHLNPFSTGEVMMIVLRMIYEIHKDPDLSFSETLDNTLKDMVQSVENFKIQK